ncbi:MAG: PAS domain S-box protein, partial [Anaerolineae bacterium]|nr:PAS domain S-box protein [Anaerolineae bacterium]
MLLTLVVTKGIYNPTRRVFAALLGVSILWNLFIFGMRTSPDAATALFWERLVAMTAYFFPLLYYHFTLLLTGRKGSKPFLVPAYVFGVVSAALGLTTDLVVPGVRRTAWAWSPQAGPLGVLMLALIYLYVLLGALVLFRAYRHLRSYRERNRLAYVLLGSSFIFLGGFLDLAPVVGIYVYPGTIVGDVVFAALITVAILRYELLDLKVVLRRSLFYAVLGGLVGGTYLLVVLAVGKLPSGLLGQRGTIVAAMAVVVASILLRPLWDPIQWWIDRLLFPAHHNALLVVDQLGQQITKILQLEQLASIVEKETARAFQSERVKLLVYKGDRLWAPVAKGAHAGDWERSVRDGEPVIGWLQRERRPLSQEELNILPQFKGLWEDEISYWRRVGLGLLMPLFIEDRLIAILALGPKISGQEYEPQEHQLLSIVASQLATAIENARLYEELRKELTERERAEEAEKASKERYRTLFDGVPMGLYRTAPDGRILLANPTLVRMLGYSSLDELALRNLEEEGFDPGYPRSQFRERVEREGEVKGLETAWTRRDGSVIFVRESAKAIRGDDGTVLYYEGTVEDITERKRAEEEIREVREFSDDLIASMQDGFSVLDSSGVHIDVNSAFCQMTGFSREELIGVGPP